MKICLQKSIIVLTAHIRHTLVAIFECMKEYTLEKNHSNVIFVWNLFLKKSIFKIIFVRILENVHFYVCIAIRGLPEKKLYKNMHVLPNNFSCNLIYWKLLCRRRSGNMDHLFYFQPFQNCNIFSPILNKAVSSSLCFIMFELIVCFYFNKQNKEFYIKSEKLFWWKHAYNMNPFNGCSIYIYYSEESCTVITEFYCLRHLVEDSKLENMGPTMTHKKRNKITYFTKIFKIMRKHQYLTIYLLHYWSWLTDCLVSPVS